MRYRQAVLWSRPLTGYGGRQRPALSPLANYQDIMTH